MELCVKIENDKIYILYNGYNIIAKTIYNGNLAKRIYNLIQKEVDEDLKELTDIKHF